MSSEDQKKNDVKLEDQSNTDPTLSVTAQIKTNGSPDTCTAIKQHPGSANEVPPIQERPSQGSHCKNVTYTILIVMVAMGFGYFIGQGSETIIIVKNDGTDNVVDEVIDVDEHRDSKIQEPEIYDSASTVLTLGAKLADKFMSVKIKKRDLDAAEKRVRGELIENWEEKVHKNSF